MEASVVNGREKDEDVAYEIPNRVFVGGLSQATSELELESFFSDHGRVTDVRIVCDRKTGRNKGFGFVTFDDERTVKNLIRKGSLEYKGHRIRLRKAVRKALGGQYNYSAIAAVPPAEVPTASAPIQLYSAVANTNPQFLYSYGMPLEHNMYYYYYSPHVMPTYVPATPYGSSPLLGYY